MLCDLFSEKQSDTTKVVENGVLLKEEGNGFVYYNKQAIFESKNELLKAEMLNMRGGDDTPLTLKNLDRFLGFSF